MSVVTQIENNCFGVLRCAEVEEKKVASRGAATGEAVVMSSNEKKNDTTLHENPTPA